MGVAGKIFDDSFLPIILFKGASLRALYFFSVKACWSASLWCGYPDPSFHFDAHMDPDPAAHQTDAYQRSLCYRPPRLHFEPPCLHCERSRPPILFWAFRALDFDHDSDPDPNPVFGFYVDPDPDFHLYLDSQNAGGSVLIRISNTSWFLLNILV